MPPFPLILLCLPNREECPPPLNPLEKPWLQFRFQYLQNVCSLIHKKPMHPYFPNAWFTPASELFLMTDIKIKSSPHSSLTRKISPRYSSSSHLISVLNLLSTFSKISQQWKFSQREITFRSKISGGVAFIFFAVFGGPLPSLPHF